MQSRVNRLMRCTKHKTKGNKDEGEKHTCIDVLRVWRWYTWEVHLPSQKSNAGWNRRRHFRILDPWETRDDCWHKTSQAQPSSFNKATRADAAHENAATLAQHLQGFRRDKLNVRREIAHERFCWWLGYPRSEQLARADTIKKYDQAWQKPLVHLS